MNKNLLIFIFEQFIYFKQLIVYYKIQILFEIFVLNILNLVVRLINKVLYSSLMHLNTKMIYLQKHFSPSFKSYWNSSGLFGELSTRVISSKYITEIIFDKFSSFSFSNKAPCFLKVFKTFFEVESKAP